MVNEETNKGTETAKADAGEGDKSKTDDPIERANKAAERLEKANEEQARILSEQKEFEAKRILGGKTSAGQESDKPKEETDQDRKDYYEDVLKGKFNKKKE